MIAGARDKDVMEASQALCNSRHPSLTQGGTTYCTQCRDDAGVVVLKLEGLGWMCHADAADYWSDDEG